jgi:hypothetical protein
LTPLVATNELNTPCATRLTADDDIEEMAAKACCEGGMFAQTHPLHFAATDAAVGPAGVRM